MLSTGWQTQAPLHSEVQRCRISTTRLEISLGRESGDRWASRRCCRWFNPWECRYLLESLLDRWMSAGARAPLFYLHEGSNSHPARRSKKVSSSACLPSNSILRVSNNWGSQKLKCELFLQEKTHHWSPYRSEWGHLWTQQQESWSKVLYWSETHSTEKSLLVM